MRIPRSVSRLGSTSSLLGGQSLSCLGKCAYESTMRRVGLRGGHWSLAQFDIALWARLSTVSKLRQIFWVTCPASCLAAWHGLPWSNCLAVWLTRRRLVAGLRGLRSTTCLPAGRQPAGLHACLVGCLLDRLIRLVGGPEGGLSYPVGRSAAPSRRKE